VDIEASLEEAIMALLRARGPDKTICPSEAARCVSPNDWRPLMVATRSVAARLASQRRLEVTQRGEPVDPSTLRGPSRLRLPRA
jgi:hypothetical protein